MAAVNGIRLHYQQVGKGPDLVMVHGLAANMAFWYLKVVPELASHFRVTVYDLRGHGRSDLAPSGYDVGSMGVDLSMLLEQVGIERAHLVGHSFGGAVALGYALDHPESVETLTLADATVYALQPIDTGQDWAYWDAWRQQLAGLGIEVPARMPKVAYGLLEELADPRWQDARQRNTSSEFFVPFGLWNGARKAAERWLTLLRTTNAWREFQAPDSISLARLREFRRPVLLIYGARSRWLPTCQTLAETLPDRSVLVLPDVGHFHPLLRPQEFVKGVRAHLNRGIRI